MPAGPGDMVAVACGAYHSMGLMKDGTVRKWGYDEYPLGGIPSSVKNVTAIAVGTFYSMVLKSDGSVVRWGFSQYGGVMPDGLTDVIALAAGYDFGLALRDATLDSKPVISVQPTNRTVAPGTAITLAVTADGGGAYLSYQWRKDGVAIPGATGSVLGILSTTAQDSGKYDVVITDHLGVVTSAAANLTVPTDAALTRLINISSRAYCGTGNNVTIGGFVITGQVAKQVLIRALGPTLTTQGLGMTEVLQDPAIEIHDASHGNVVLATNDNWTDNANASEIRTVGARVGATPIDVNDTKSSALLLTLDPGVYSFIASSKSGAAGIVLVEVYDAD